MARVFIPLGLDSSGYNAGTGEIVFARSPYLDRVTENGLTPVLVSPRAPQAIIDDLYGICSGVMLMGGDDIDASLYGRENHPVNIVADAARNVFERALVLRALADRKPLLGICRGSQMLAVATGGTLFQHLPDHFPAEAHRVDSSTTYEADLLAIIHSVRLHDGSKAFSLIKNPVISSNSGHHQSIDRIGDVMRVGGTSAGGVIEIIEHPDPDYFCFGIQSHPEVQPGGDFAPFFREFAKAVRTFASK